MIQLTNAAAEARVRRAAENAAPNRAEEIWSRPFTPAAGDEWYLEGTAAPKKKNRAWRYAAALAAAAALLALALLPGMLVKPKPEATVYLDVNPSVELRVNSERRVISARADNSDGEKILEGMDLEQTDVDVALNAILGSMVRNGYLTETKNVVLLSVESENGDYAAQLQRELSARLGESLQDATGSGLVLSKSVHVDDEAAALARKYGITPGKAVLVMELARDWPNLDLEDLAELSMTDLVRLLTDQNVNLRDYLEWDADDQEWELEWPDDDRDDDDDHDDADDRDDDDDPDDADDRDDDDDDVDDPDDDDHDDADDDDDDDDADEHRNTAPGNDDRDDDDDPNDDDDDVDDPDDDDDDVDDPDDDDDVDDPDDDDDVDDPDDDDDDVDDPDDDDDDADDPDDDDDDVDDPDDDDDDVDDPDDDDDDVDDPDDDDDEDDRRAAPVGGDRSDDEDDPPAREEQDDDDDDDNDDDDNDDNDDDDEDND